MKDKIILIQDFPARVAGFAQPYTVEVPKNYLIESLFIREEHTITDDGLGAAPAYTQDAGLRQSALIEFETEADTPVFVTGRSLSHYNQICNGVLDDVEATPAAIGAAHTLVHVQRLPFADMQAASLPAKLETMFLGLGRTTANLRVTPAAVNQMMINGVGGTVAITGQHFSVFAKVIEMNDEAERQLFRDAQVFQLRIREEIETIMAPTPYAPFLNKHVNRGHQTLAFMSMMTDNDTRSPDMPLSFGVTVADIPLLPVPTPEELITRLNYEDRGFVPPDGVHYINLDQGHNHEAAPWTIGSENFSLNRAVNAPAGTGLMHVTHIEKANARYQKKAQ